jgi:hypothetical protein
MCGGGSKKPAAAQPSPVVGYSYTPADNSNAQRQAAAVDPGTGQPTSYGSELSSGSSTSQTTTTTGGM